MVQEPLPESRPDVELSQEQPGSDVESGSLKNSLTSSLPYSVDGPHARVRQMLMWVNRLLAYDTNDFVSGISVRELREALLRFQKDVRVMARDQEVSMGVSSRFPSSTPTARPSPRSPIKRATRQFKN